MAWGMLIISRVIFSETNACRGKLLIIGLNSINIYEMKKRTRIGEILAL